jgi:hypothetical protein
MTKNRKRPTAQPATETPKSRRLDLVVKKGTTPDRAATDMMAAGLAANASLVLSFSEAEHGELSLNDMVNSLRDAGSAVNCNDFAGPERMLSAQAVSLNAIFAELARRSAVNMGTYMDTAERYMRLALKAQSQCRATVETLAAIKNPPVVYAKQANITSGPQQVNNGVPGFSDASQGARARGENGTEQTKLLEGTQHGGTVLDAGATGATAGRHQVLAAVGAVHRTKEPGR